MENKHDLELSITEQTTEPGQLKSFVVIQSGQLTFISDMFKWASKWGKKNGYEMLVRNTPNGMYELVGEEIN